MSTTAETLCNWYTNLKLCWIRICRMQIKKILYQLPDQKRGGPEVENQDVVLFLMRGVHKCTVIYTSVSNTYNNLYLYRIT